MRHDQSQTGDEPGIWRTVKSDFKSGELGSSLRRDYRELQDVFLEEERQERLARMGRVKRWLVVSWWLLKALILKLSPVRRLLLLAGLVFSIILGRGNADGDNRVIIGLAMILFVLLLELKDKLLARDELEAGRKVQEALMPERSPAIPGWSIWLYTSSANEVGGDLLDFMAVGENRFAVAIGDVSGKGLSAALLMAKLQATLRATAEDYRSLEEFAAKLNRIFHRDCPATAFASLCYVELQGNSGKARLVNAGHMPPLLIHDTQIRELATPAPALGLSEASHFTEEQVVLQRNDVLLLYSDGLTEARNVQNEFFGEERLRSLIAKLYGLPPGEFGARILETIRLFVGEARARDDMTLMLLQRTTDQEVRV